MDNKFYVSLEVEELLIEKGYPIEKDAPIYNKHGDVIGCYPANRPTKSEAIDWLESKGILIATSFTYNRKWFCTIKSLVRDEMVSTLDFPTRLQAEEAAIIKALTLLN